VPAYNAVFVINFNYWRDIGDTSEFLNRYLRENVKQHSRLVVCMHASYLYSFRTLIVRGIHGELFVDISQNPSVSLIFHLDTLSFRISTRDIRREGIYNNHCNEKLYH